MPTYRAEWVLPIAGEPILDGRVVVESGRIAGLERGPGPFDVDLGRSVVLPALVNAHTHVELSHLHGRIPPSDRFTDWIRGLLEARRAFPDFADPGIVASAKSAIGSARAAGYGADR